MNTISFFEKILLSVVCTQMVFVAWYFSAPIIPNANKIKNKRLKNLVVDKNKLSRVWLLVSQHSVEMEKLTEDEIEYLRLKGYQIGNIQNKVHCLLYQ